MDSEPPIYNVVFRAKIYGKKGKIRSNAKKQKNIYIYLLELVYDNVPSNKILFSLFSRS